MTEKERVQLLEEREQRRLMYIAENEGTWKQIGSVFQESRETFGYTKAYVAQRIGISPKRLTNFESGAPVRDSKLITRALYHFYKNEWLRDNIHQTVVTFDEYEVR